MNRTFHSIDVQRGEQTVRIDYTVHWSNATPRVFVLGAEHPLGWAETYARDNAPALISHARAQNEAGRLVAAAQPVVDEFSGTIHQYYDIGPDYTLKDGTELLHASALLDRGNLLAALRDALRAATGGTDHA